MSVSSDVPLQAPTYLWQQLDGPPLSLEGADTANPRFTAPTTATAVAVRLKVTVVAAPHQHQDSLTVVVRPTGLHVRLGSDLLVEQGNPVTLHAAVSGGTVTSLRWAQVAGPTVTLTGDRTTSPSFVAPEQAALLEFEATATAASGEVSKDRVRVAVTSSSRYRVYSSSNVKAYSGQAVTLQLAEVGGRGTMFAWRQVAGPTVVLANAQSSAPTFVAPMVVSPTRLLFNVVAQETTTSQGVSTFVEVEVLPVSMTNLLVSAGPDRTVIAGDTVELHADALTTPSGSIAYEWRERSDAGVVLTNATAQTASFVVPPTVTRLSFEVRATDGNGSVSDSVDLLVQRFSVTASLVYGLGATRKGVFVGAPVQLSAAPFAGKPPFTYAWAQTRGPAVPLTDASSATPHLTTAAEDLYSFEVAVTDALGNSANGVVTFGAIARKWAPLAPIDAGVLSLVVEADRSVLEGEVVQVVAQAGGVQGPFTWSWQEVTATGVTLSDAGTSGPSFVAPSVTAATELALRGTVTAGTASETATVHYTVKDRPISVAVTPDVVAYAGVPVPLGVTATGGRPPLSFSWTVASGPATTVQGASRADAWAAPATEGTYTFRVTVSDAIGNSATGEIVARIHAVPLAPQPGAPTPLRLSLAAPPTLTVIEGAPVYPAIAVINANGPVSYRWQDLSDAGVTFLPDAGAERPTFTAPLVEANSNLELRLGVTVTDLDGPVTTQLVYRVLDQPVSVTASPSAVTTRVGAPVVLHAVGQGGVGALSWRWAQRSGPMVSLSAPTTSAPSFTPTVAGAYVFEATASDQGPPGRANTGAAQVSVRVIDTLAVALGDDQSAPAGAVVSLHPVVTGGTEPVNLAYDWQLDTAAATFAEGTTASDVSPRVTASPAATTVIHVSLTVTDTASAPPAVARASQTITFTVPVTIDAGVVDAGPTLPPGQQYPDGTVSATLPEGGGCPDGQTLRLVRGLEQVYECQDIATLGGWVHSQPGPPSPCMDSSGIRAPKGAIFKAYKCGDNSPDVCEYLFDDPTACGPNELPAIVLDNPESGQRTMERKCLPIAPGAGTGSCFGDWWQQTSQTEKCSLFSPSMVYTEAFNCTYCCVGDGCNEDTVCAVKTGTRVQFD